MEGKEELWESGSRLCRRPVKWEDGAVSRACLWKRVSIFPATVGYNAGCCSLMFAESCLGSVTTALLTSQGGR